MLTAAVKWGGEKTIFPWDLDGGGSTRPNMMRGVARHIARRFRYRSGRGRIELYLSTALPLIPPPTPMGAAPPLVARLVIAQLSALVRANYAAILLHERNDPAAAIPHARRALEIQPADPPALFTLGEASLRTGDLARAADALEQVVSLAPRTSGGVDALHRLGPAYERMGRREDAASAYRRLLEWRPADARAREALKRLGAGGGPSR